MKGRRIAAALLLLAGGTATAEEDLLKVGKTPAEKLEEKTRAVKDGVDKALEKIERKNQALTEALHGFEAPVAEPDRLPDPTAPDETFRQTFRTLLRGQRRDGDTLPPMPRVELGALVMKPDLTPAALLKIDDRTVLVKDGEEVTLIREGQIIHLRVQAIDEAGVRVLVLPHNELLTLH